MSPIASHAPYRLEKFVLGAAPALLLALASCSYEAHHDHNDPPPPPAPWYDLWEIEPNDSACCPDGIGQLWVGDSLVIGGDITELGPDFFDGFAFQNAQPCDIEFELVPVYSNADLDLCVFDPQLGAFAFCFETGNAIEIGRFSVPAAFTDFHLVLSSYALASEYRLNVHCVPITFGGLVQASPEAPRSGRAMPVERYFDDGATAEASEDEPRVIALGELIEIDEATGEVREWPLRLLENGAGRRAKGASERLIRREN